MALRLNSFRFLKRLNVPTTQADRQGIERVLGAARFFSVLVSLLAVYLYPTEPPSYSTAAGILLTLWVVYSGSVLLWLRYRPVSPEGVLFLHVMDILWPTVIMSVTEGPHSPFFGFFVAALIGAAFRWGFPEAVMTSALGLGVLGVQAFLIKHGDKITWGLEGDFEANRFIIRCSYLLTVGLLIGYLAEGEKEKRAESALINRVLSHIRVEQGLAQSMQATVQEYLRTFDSRRAFIVLQNISLDRLFLWQVSSENEVRTFYREVASRDFDRYLLSSEPRTFFACREFESVIFKAVDEGEFKQRTRSEMPALPFYTSDFKSLLSTWFSLDEEWRGRLVLIDARVGRGAERELRFAEDLLRRCAPAINGVYLLRRLRTRAGAMERARVARDLHDGAIQSLISVEMQVDVLRRNAERAASPMFADLQHVQKLLQDEVLNLRELMQQLRPADMSPQQFLDFMADTVDRFRRDTGISASFVSDLQDVEMSSNSCREMGRILQEALVNIRKHSGADNVLVRFGRENGTWKLVVDDNGRGFDFNGRLNLQELNNARKGPTVIKERVRTIGGDILIDSVPGRGARLEVTLTQKGHGAHG